MSSVTTLLSLYLPLVGAALVIAMAAIALVDKYTQQHRLVVMVFLVVLGGGLIPCLAVLSPPLEVMDLGSIPWGLAGWGRIIMGDLSVLSLMWFLWRVSLRLVPRWRCNIPTSKEEYYIAASLLGTGLLLYPTALGITRFDLYALGYYPVLLMPLLFALFAWCLLYRHTLPALLLATATVGWLLGILESDNLWDYLLDPVVTLYALSLVLRGYFKQHRARQQHVAP